MRQEIQIVRQSLREYEGRVERVEMLARGFGAPAVRSPSIAPDRLEMPSDLAVVKMQPKRGDAPALATQVRVKEPPVETFDAGAREDGEMLFARGKRLLSTGGIDQGLALLQAFAEASPTHPEADNALYLCGQTYLKTNDDAKAQAVLLTLLDRYPAGDVVPDAMMRLGESFARSKNVSAASHWYGLLVERFEGTQTASLAAERLKSLDTVRKP